MINVFGNNIVSVFTNGVSVKEIYTYGEKVWPSYVPPTPTEYYIRWTPSNITGTFSIGGNTYNLQDYSGYFSDFSGVITYSAFKSNSEITHIETNAYMINPYAFEDCTSLIDVDLSNCVDIGKSAFAGCIRLTDVSAPVCLSLRNSVFKTCVKLTSVEFPMCLSVENNTFQSCLALQTVSLPECTFIRGTATFAYCSSLSQIYMPKNRLLGMGMFYGCSALTELSLPNCESVFEEACKNCVNLESITLGGSSVAPIYFTEDRLSYYPFYGTKITPSTGYIYVLSSLVNEYKSTEYWSYYSDRIFPIQN